VPEATCLVEDPAPGEAVPVSLTLPRWLRPMTLLVRMFGLPDYHAFDPTPYLTTMFLLFFGICFGDVIYGLLLCTVAIVMARRLRAHEWVADFFRLFLYGGITTVLFGALTGSWASDLWKPEYLGQGNSLMRVKDALAVFDPMDKLVMGLLIALGIGVVNQFYGILLNMYAAVRRRDYVAAVFDGGSWLLVLPGFIILASTLFTKVPATVSKIGWGLFGLGYLMLIVSQGRHVPGLFGKALAGVVSIYGIFGSYGCVSFIGDTLSYSRLLALGLTTSIIGFAFNIVAGLFRGIPIAGPVLFWLVVIGGHVFNFFISVLGGFVHSARLILLEFFGRFYQSGGQEFAPYGFRNERIQITRT
jgi:V/A-type H+-transporting ATPase subunit I